ncbi:phosphonate metabolism protein/1,5-bisphosphokinase (PRPP-forming) PhnN [Mucilaginibacter celer]|uniref:Ribose 1,5-bisphosphate phosphokinase PhnN n=1 Tax=Mucilaginibacter celer TaxID=2305508 RepID=A0A494VN87_9SPHI|nr:phosphonate metabolism protein/1,5-bisphosphokinase (PRPP-forming) PhnN [Mucilaginibacter celer]AYL94460.1 phosphonate metabolism protein/1,5-bisphosphokinase (PRPP-forming) PhnN [Mucilaginibacter celer]
MSKLFYVIGPSGAGKDTLMNYARQQINGSENVIFAHRYITRPPFAGSENHVSLSNEEFELMKKGGMFALHWGSHGKYYGIGQEINNWLNKGFNVVVNGSREYLPVAQRLYPDLFVILITASAEVLIKRLAGRGRETDEEIAARIARTAGLDVNLENCTTIQNNGGIEDAGNELVSLLSATQKILI